MNTSRALLLSAFLSGLIFSSSTLLLVAIGSRPITIQIEEKPLFTGRIQDLSVLYLEIATGLSLGIGLTTFSVLGWRNAVKQLDRATQQVAQLKQQLNQQEGMVESLKFSESKLQAMGLKFFLDTVPADAALKPSHHPSPPPPLPISSTHQPQQILAAPQTIPPASSQRAETLLATHSQSHHHTPQIEELKIALKQIMSQVEQLQPAQANDHGGS